MIYKGLKEIPRKSSKWGWKYDGVNFFGSKIKWSPERKHRILTILEKSLHQIPVAIIKQRTLGYPKIKPTLNQLELKKSFPDWNSVSTEKPGESVESFINTIKSLFFKSTQINLNPKTCNFSTNFCYSRWLKQQQEQHPPLPNSYFKYRTNNLSD